MSEDVTAAVDTAPAVEVAPTQEAAPAEAVGATQVESPAFAIPEEYSEKPWAEKVKSESDLWKQVDNLQGLVGKKSIVPTAESTDEEWSTFNDELGDNLTKLNQMRVPEAYEWSEFELPEGADSEYFNKSTEAFSSIAKEAGLSQSQADKVRSEYLKHEMESVAAHQKSIDDEFDALGRETWGDKYEEKIAQLSPIFQKILPEDVRANLQNAPASQLIPLLMMAEHIKASGQPDGMPNSSQGLGMTKDQAREQLSDMRKKARQNPAKYQKEFNELQDRLRTVINS